MAALLTIDTLFAALVGLFAFLTIVMRKMINFKF